MKVTIDIECDNAAFTGAPELEVERILNELARKVGGEGMKNIKLYDVNGNSVGTMKVE